MRYRPSCCLLQVHSTHCLQLVFGHFGGGIGLLLFRWRLGYHCPQRQPGWAKLTRSISVVFVVKFCVVTNVLQDEGSAPSRSNLCNFGSISTPAVRQSTSLRFQARIRSLGRSTWSLLCCSFELHRLVDLPGNFVKRTLGPCLCVCRQKVFCSLWDKGEFLSFCNAIQDGLFTK